LYEGVAVTTLATKREGGGGFFTIYKPGQGKWVRWGTVGGMALIVLCGTFWLTGSEQLLVDKPLAVKAAAGAIWTVLGALLTFWLVNSPKMAEFLIMTESEMRKVSWPSRREVISSTKVVILLTLILGVLLYLVDYLFLNFFIWIGVS
jgi:preprotein translocase subunit SecE